MMAFLTPPLFRLEIGGLARDGANFSRATIQEKIQGGGGEGSEGLAAAVKGTGSNYSSVSNEGEGSSSGDDDALVE